MLIRHLKFFVTLAEEQHFGRAAEQCSVTQPTLSQAIRKLEEDLNLSLIVRGHRFLSLTAEGEKVLRWGRQILADYESLHDDLRGRKKGGLTGTLRLGVIPGALAISLLAALTENLGQLLLIAPFGASCVLLFALPQSPLARPRNVIGGHLISALVGLLVLTVLGDGVVAMGLGVGLAIALMQFSGTLHPPAGGDPLVVILAGAGWPFLLLPIATGTASLVILAWLYHRFVSKRAYPA